MMRLRRFLTDENGATSVEYAVMLAMILVACLATVAYLGQQSASLWSDNETGLQSAFQQVN